MALVWSWDEKCGEITIEQTINGITKDFTVNCYTGNAYLIMLYEFEEDGEEKYNMFSFWVDEYHMKNCLGLDKKGGYTKNIHTDFKKVRLNKAKCRHINKIISALVKAFDNLEIEIYTEN